MVNIHWEAIFVFAKHNITGGMVSCHPTDDIRGAALVSGQGQLPVVDARWEAEVSKHKSMIERVGRNHESILTGQNVWMGGGRVQYETSHWMGLEWDDLRVARCSVSIESLHANVV